MISIRCERFPNTQKVIKMQKVNWQGFVMGFMVAVMLMTTLGAAIVGESEEDRYLKACAALQGEYIFGMYGESLTGQEALTNQERDVARARMSHWIGVVKRYQP
jgi:hypothetical protein